MPTQPPKPLQIEDIIEKILTKFGDEPWLYDVVTTRDDAGTRIEVQVEDHLFVDDVIPRKLDGFYLVVRRVVSGLP